MVHLREVTLPHLFCWYAGLLDITQEEIMSEFFQVQLSMVRGKYLYMQQGMIERGSAEEQEACPCWDYNPPLERSCGPKSIEEEAIVHMYRR